MYQTTVKIVQIVITLAVVAAFISHNHEKISVPAMIGVGVLVAFFATVVPWLIFKAIEQGFHDFRRWRTQRREPSQPTRIDPVFTEPLDHSISHRRIASDSRPRISE